MTPTNTEALAAELEQQRISNWVQRTGTPPRVNGTKPDPLCQEAAAELRRLDHNNRVLTDALWKACGDDEATVNATIESQGELK